MINFDDLLRAAERHIQFMSYGPYQYVQYKPTAARATKPEPIGALSSVGYVTSPRGTSLGRVLAAREFAQEFAAAKPVAVGVMG